MAAISTARSLLVAHVNAQSLYAHFAEIESRILASGLHVLAVSESWLSASRGARSVGIPGYDLLHNDRPNRAGGGVALYVHESIQARVVARSRGLRLRPEFLIVSLSIDSFKVLCVVVYNPPNVGYWSDVEEAILDCNVPSDLVMLLGDLNLDFRSRASPCMTLRDSLATLGLTPLAFNPTHHSTNSHTLLDYICVSNMDEISAFWQVSVPAISDHDFLFAQLSYVVPDWSGRVTCRRDYGRFNLELFERDLRAVRWSRVDAAACVDEKVHFMSSSIQALYDKHAPYVTRVARRRPTPWMTAELKSLIRARNSAWSRFKRFGRANDREQYRSLRNRVKSAARGAKASYYRRRLSGYTDSRDLWRSVDDLGVKASAPDLSGEALDLDALNGHFVGLGVPLHAVGPSYLGAPPAVRFFFRHIEPSELFEVVALAHSNARGSDDISLNQIRQCLPVIWPVLINIFDASFQSGVFPTAWKHALVRPLPKCRQPLSLTDYRPISIFRALAKSLEELAVHQMSQFLHDNDVLDLLQSGVRTG